MQIQSSSKGRSPLLNGRDQFERVLQHFSGQFKSIKGSWAFGSNLREFNYWTKGGFSIHEAAFRTRAGKQAKAYGYSSIEIPVIEGRKGQYTYVEVLFSRID